ncbi:hypothetical protein NC651_005211 [Populus alba x Populus x berolinensis]|nr:hypothetical protein NC651_005211 [Populus alba x Populus x berolinensis]
MSYPSSQHNFPRTLDALILHLLSPLGAKVITRKFDEIDQQTTEGDRNKIYQGFYGAFDDQFAAMACYRFNFDSSLASCYEASFCMILLLHAKMKLILAFENSLDKYLGVNFDVPPPI